MLTLNRTIGILLSLTFVSVQAQSNHFYIGGDLIQSTLKAKHGFGRNILDSDPTEWALYVGNKFTNLFGLEAGYGQQFVQMQDGVALDANARFPGAGLAYPITVTNIRQKIRHPYLGLTALIPANNILRVSTMLGLSCTKVNYRFDTSMVNSTPISPPHRDYFVQTKLIPIARLAIHCQFTKFAQIRGFAQWRHTSRFKMNGDGDFSSLITTTTVKLRNSFTVGVGLSLSPL